LSSLIFLFYTEQVVICLFFLFATTEGLMKAQYKHSPKHKEGTVFYRETPPAVASAKAADEAKSYLDMLEQPVDPLVSTTTNPIGRFSVVGSKSFDTGIIGTLVVYYPTVAKQDQALKAFIADRKTIRDVKVTDLEFFADLFEKKDEIFKVAPSSATTTAAVPQSQQEAQRIGQESLEEAARNEATGIIANRREPTSFSGYEDPKDRALIVRYVNFLLKDDPVLSLAVLKIVTDDKNKGASSSVILKSVNDQLQKSDKKYKTIEFVGIRFLNKQSRGIKETKKSLETSILGDSTVH
jgi:hypothetical protein